MKKKVAIVGASGYSGEELVRLLLHHPDVELTAVTSRQSAGIVGMYRDLRLNAFQAAARH